MPALFSAAYLFIAGLLAARLTRPPATLVSQVGRRRPSTILRTTISAVAVGGVLRFSELILEECITWGLAIFAIVVFTQRLGSTVIAWRRLYRGLDEACTGPDDAMGDRLLALHKRPTGYHLHQHWVARLLAASLHAHSLGRTDRAVRWLGALDLRRLSYDHGLAVAQYRVAFALALGQIDAARTTLKQVPNPVVQPAFEEAFAILRALVAAIDGEASEARLVSVRDARKAAKGPAVDSWWTVEAHLLAALGEAIEAQAILRDLKGRHPFSLERIARHDGPASPLAARMLAETPYR